MYYKFDSNDYPDNDSGRQELLEAVGDALSTEAWNDPDLTTDDERQEAEGMAWDGTHYAAPFWDNCMALMQQSPYTLNIERVDGEMQWTE